MAKVLGELEQKVMDIVWASNVALKPAEVKTSLNGNLAYTTVMTILKRLTDKGLLSRDQKDGAYYYSAAVSKENFAENKLQNLFKGLLSSYGDLAISQFLTSVKDDPASIKALKKYLKSDLNEK